MFTARAPGSWPGLIVILSVAGALGPVAGRGEEGAPGAPSLPLGAPEVIVDAAGTVDLAAQVLWSDPDRIHLLGLLPPSLLAIAPGTGIVEVLAVQGGGPFDIQGPMALLGAGAAPGEVVVLQPARLRATVFGREGPVSASDLEIPVTGCVPEGDRAWWLGPVPWDVGAGDSGRVQLRRGPAPAAGRIRMSAPVAWSARQRGDVESILTGQYFTRLLRGPAGRLWRVVLGMQGRADLIDPATAESRPVLAGPGEGAWIEASVDGGGVLHVLVAGGPGSHGRRILRFDPRERAALVGDRDWSTGAVDPAGKRWAAVDAETGEVLVYRLADLTTGPSNR